MNLNVDSNGNVSFNGNVSEPGDYAVDIELYEEGDVPAGGGRINITPAPDTGDYDGSLPEAIAETIIRIIATLKALTPPPERSLDTNGMEKQMDKNGARSTEWSQLQQGPADKKPGGNE